MFNQTLRKFLKFIIAGVINTVINISGMYALLYFQIFYLIASAAGFILGAFSGFAINFLWTFKERSLFMKKFYKYFIIQLMNLIFTLILVFYLKEFLLLNVILSQLIAIMLTTIINFFLSSKFVFTES
jgi:putative flippase GtrA